MVNALCAWYTRQPSNEAVQHPDVLTFMPATFPFMRLPKESLREPLAASSWPKMGPCVAPLGVSSCQNCACCNWLVCGSPSRKIQPSPLRSSWVYCAPGPLHRHWAPSARSVHHLALIAMVSLSDDWIVPCWFTAVCYARCGRGQQSWASRTLTQHFGHACPGRVSCALRSWKD